MIRPRRAGTAGAHAQNRRTSMIACSVTPAVGRGLALATLVTALGLATQARAVELNPAAVTFKTADQFVWRDPTDQVQTNQTILVGDPTKAGSLYININKFKSGRFGNAHYHPNDRYIA